MPSLFMDFSPVKSSPDFRRIWFGSLFSTLGFQITAAAITLEIYALTGSAAALGAIGLVAVLPLILGGLYGGVVADAYDRRKVALAASVGMWVLACLLTLHSWLDLGQVWVLYALIACEALLQPLNQSARGAIIPKLVGRKMLPAANTLIMSGVTLSMMLGPMLGGLLVAQLGYRWTYLINIFAFMVGLWALYRLPAMPPETDGTRQKPGLSTVLEGLSFVRRNTVVGMSFLVDIIGMVFAQARPLIPVLAALTLGGGEVGVGFLLSAMAIGAFVGMLFSGFLKNIVCQGRFLTLSYTVWGAGFIAFGLVALAFQGRTVTDSVADNLLPLTLAGACLAVMGWADALGGVYRTTIIQTQAPDRMRGRLQGLFIITVAGGPNLGTALMGSSAELVGAAPTAIAGGAAVILLIALATFYQPALWSYSPEATDDERQEPVH